MKVKELLKSWVIEVKEDAPIIIKTLILTTMIVGIVLLFAPFFVLQSQKEIKSSSADCINSSCVEIYRSEECSIFRTQLNPGSNYLYSKFLYFSNKPNCEAYKSFIKEFKYMEGKYEYE